MDCARHGRGGARNPVSGLRLLAVEDQPANVALLRAVMNRSPHPELRNADLSVANTLADGRRLLAGGGFDVVLLDIRLPDGSGLDLAREFASRLPGTRFLVVTANALPGDEAAALAAGAHAFMSKPYDPATLAATVLELAGVRPTAETRQP
jgi:CheY-like chemotaxis protein